MLEIIILFFLCRSLGTTLRDKGRNPIGFQILLVLAWIACEFIGGFVGYIFGAIVTGDEDNAFIVGIGGALAGAISAAVTVFMIAKSLHPAVETEPSYRDDSYGPGWRDRDRERLRRRDEAYGRDVDHDAITDRPEDLPRRRADDRVQE
jgi:hypothetical protein